MSGIARRSLLSLAATAGAAGALFLEPVTFAHAADGDEETKDEETKKVSGRLPTGAPDFVYVPVEVPPGVREIAVRYRYDKPEVPAGTVGNALDIGVFDERGTGPDGRGFRGWSGGARDSFTLSAERATPGYLAGPIRPGTWHVVLGPYTVAPQGLAYELEITLRYGRQGTTPRPVYPPERARGRGRAWYRGDCHIHTVHSDGSRTPEQAAAAARAAGLDFLVTTEHNTISGHAAWQGLWGDDLLVLCGEEVTTRNGHYLALGTEPGTFVDWRYRSRDGAFARWARRIHRAGGLVVPAHPNCPFVACQWKFGYEHADAVEVWNGPWTADDELAVAAWDNMLTAAGDSGRWLPAMGNSDAHTEEHRVGLPQTVVLAEDLTRRAILDGIRAGRSWLAESAELDLSFEVTGPRGQHAGIGERLTAPADAEVVARLTVSGAPAGGTVRLWTDEGEMLSATVPDSGRADVSWRTTPSLAAYVRAEIRHRPADEAAELPGAMAAMTNPIWLDRA